MKETISIFKLKIIGRKIFYEKQKFAGTQNKKVRAKWGIIIRFINTIKEEDIGNTTQDIRERKILS